jgi:zinc protease
VPAHAATLVTIATDAEATASSVSVLYKRSARPVGAVADERREYVEALADMMLNARLGELGQRPNAPYLGAGAGGGRWVRTEEAYSIGAGVSEGGLVRGLEGVLAELDRVRRSGFTAAELDRERRNLLRAVERQYTERDKTSNDAHVGRLVEHALTGESAPSAAYSWAFAQREVPTITLAEVNRSIADRVDGASRVVAVQAPAKAGSVPPQDSLLAVFDRVARSTLAAYADSAADSPLVARVPNAGRIVSTRAIPEIGVTEWTLSNGARVLLKPTDFKADEVILQAFSPGGTSVVPDSDFVAASLAGAVMQQGGLGTFDAIALQKRLAGTAAGVSPYISGQSEGLSGQASPKDLETLFQLLYLTVTAPRTDSAAYTAFRARVDNFLANRGSDPGSVFQDTVSVTMAQHHLRARPLTASLLRELDLGRAMRVYRDRFADAGSFAYVIVGSFNADSLRPLVERYVASLPNAARTETVRDDGQRPPTGVVQRTVRKGVEPQATTQMIFTGPMAYSRAERFSLGVLSDVLTIRLRDRIREALGGTYGVNVSTSAQRIPRQAYRVDVSFGSSPERVEELAAAVLQEIATLRDRGPTPEEVQKVRETGLRELETAQKQNRWWLGAIASTLQAGEDPRGITGERALYDTITPAGVQATARRYLAGTNYARFTLLPEAVTKPATP